MATIIKVDGTEEELNDLSLAAIQKAVGGYIERVWMLPQHNVLQAPQVLYCDEDGAMKQLSWNENASNLAGMIILGNVVVLTPEETKKEDQGNV